MTAPFAYQAWFCSVCDCEAAPDGDCLLCEQCGRRYSVDNSDTAKYIPEEEEDDE